MPISQQANRRFYRIVISYGVYTRCTSCISAATDAIEGGGGGEIDREGRTQRGRGEQRVYMREREREREEQPVTQAMTRFQSASGARALAWTTT